MDFRTGTTNERLRVLRLSCANPSRPVLHRGSHGLFVSDGGMSVQVYEIAGSSSEITDHASGDGTAPGGSTLTPTNDNSLLPELLMLLDSSALNKKTVFEHNSPASEILRTGTFHLPISETPGAPGVSSSILVTFSFPARYNAEFIKREGS